MHARRAPGMVADGRTARLAGASGLFGDAPLARVAHANAVEVLDLIGTPFAGLPVAAAIPLRAALALPIAQGG